MSIDGFGGSANDFRLLVKSIDETCEAEGMEISGSPSSQTLKNIYLGSIISDQGSNPEIVNRIAQATAALVKLQI